MNHSVIRLIAAAFVLLILASSGPVFAEEQATTLFKIVTDKDEIIIGLNAAELRSIGGPDRDAGVIARALADRRQLTVWQYAVRHGKNGELQMMPLHQIGLLASNSLRVEPYTSPLAVLPHE